MSRHITLKTPALPPPWQKLSYQEIMTRSEGQLINDGRSSRVYRFADGKNVCFLKRYNYQKIHWQYCLQKSQVQQEYENLEKIKRANLGCDTIEILAYGEHRRCRVLIDAFLLSREVAGGESLALFLSINNNHPQRKVVLEKLFELGEKIIHSGLAITDLFFRNIVVVPKEVKLYLLDVQRCDHNQRRATMKSYPQYWSNILLFCTPEEQDVAAQILAPHLPYTLNKLTDKAQQFIPKERLRKSAELAFLDR